MTELAPLLPGQVGRVALGAPKLAAVEMVLEPPSPAAFSHQVIALLGILALWLIMAGEFFSDFVVGRF